MIVVRRLESFGNLGVIQWRFERDTSSHGRCWYRSCFVVDFDVDFDSVVVVVAFVASGGS